MSKVAHRVFAPRSIEMFKIQSYEAIAEEVRQAAEAFANEVGAENVVSITENVWQNTFCVVVWHRVP